MPPDLWEYVEDNSSYHSFIGSSKRVFGAGTLDVNLIASAYRASSKGHRNQFRDSGERYFLHVLAVASILLWAMEFGLIKPDAELIAAALLHDLIENKPKRWNQQRVEEEFTRRTSRIVWSVTKPTKVRFKGDAHARNVAAYRKLDRHEIAGTLLRIADRLHNIRTLWNTPNRNRNKLEETVEFVVPRARKCGFLLEELIAEMGRQYERISKLTKRMI